MNPHTYPPLILALFKDSYDEGAFSSLMEGFPGITTLVNPPEKELLFERAATYVLKPSLVIISSRLYPESRPNLVAELKEIFPGTEILVVTLATYPLPPFEQFVADGIKHLLVTPGPDDKHGVASLQEAIVKLLDKIPWKLLDHVTAGTHVHEIRLSSSQDKEELIARLDTVLSGDSAEMEFLRQRAALLADEMIENALYGAPRDGHGKKLYAKGEARMIEEYEKILFCFAFDGTTLAMEIADGWGTLAPDMVVDYLARNQEIQAVESEEAGGRGLFIIWRFLDDLHITISPGKHTVLGGHLKADDSCFDDGRPKGFSILTE